MGLEGFNLEQAGVATLLIVMIIFAVRAGQAIILSWLAAGKEKAAKQHELELKRLEADERESAARLAIEREQNDVLRAITEQLKNNHDQAESQRQVQQAMTLTVDRLFQAVQTLNSYLNDTDARMAAVTDARVKWQSLLHADLKTIPAETQRLLQPDFALQTENIRLALDNALADMERRLLERIGPETEKARQAVHDELETMRHNLGRVLDRMGDIQTALDKLQPSSIDSSEVGDQTPKDQTIKGETDHVGNPS